MHGGWQRQAHGQRGTAPGGGAGAAQPIANADSMTIDPRSRSPAYASAECAFVHRVRIAPYTPSDTLDTTRLTTLPFV